MPQETVSSDSGPLNYLILIGAVDVLPRLFAKVLIAPEVYQELMHPDAPAVVRTWIQNPPAWLVIETKTDLLNLPGLHMGERATLTLAVNHRIRALVDDQAGRSSAERLGI